MLNQLSFKSEHPDLSSLNKNIGVRIKRLRVSNNLSQDDLASKIGRSRQYVQKIETGNTQISVKIAYHISIVLGVDITHLLIDQNFMNTGKSISIESLLKLPELQNGDVAKSIQDFVLEVANRYCLKR